MLQMLRMLLYCSTIIEAFPKSSVRFKSSNELKAFSSLAKVKWQSIDHNRTVNIKVIVHYAQCFFIQYNDTK